jgi:hypothetical protein
MTQQVQPALHIIIMQSQQAWIISQHFGSPLVQVMQTPLSIISHLHMPMVRLQQLTIMPFIMQQQLHMLPASMVHRFCIMLQAMVSSHMQVIFMPPAHFSNLKVQRGTIIMFMPVGMPMVPIPAVPMPAVPGIFIRSIIIAFIMVGSPWIVSGTGRIPPPQSNNLVTSCKKESASRRLSIGDCVNSLSDMNFRMILFSGSRRC